MNSKLLEAVKMLLDCPALNCEELEQHDIDAIEFAQNVVKEAEAEGIHFNAYLNGKLICCHSARNEDEKKSIISTLKKAYGENIQTLNLSF